jgi:uncharacterized protein with HEPN domain
MDRDKNLFRLQHIVECLEKIEFITKNLTYGDYLEDWIKQDAILRNIAIIGEAINSIDENLKEKHPNIAWLQAKGMRNFLVHEYFRVDHDAVWNTFNNDLPKLKVQILRVINDI